MKVDLFKMSCQPQDLEAVYRVLTRGTWWAQGPELTEFETKISEYLGVKYCVLFNSGTSALHATMLAYDIGPGDEVIVPSFTFIATANCVKMVGAKPVFADIEGDTLALSLESVVSKTTSKTRAIILVHFAGMPAFETKRLVDFAAENNLLLIEDVCESMGANIWGKPLGTFGETSVLSFCQGKILSTGEGGAVITNSREIAERLRLIQNHGKVGINSDFFTLGYNFRMPSVLCALGISQLDRIDLLIGSRKSVARSYNLKLKDLPIRYPNIESKSIYQMYPILLNKGSRDSLSSFLASRGVGSRVYFPPVHKSSYYRSLGYTDYLPVTEGIAKDILCIPMYPGMPEEEITYVADTLKEFFSAV